MSGNPTNRPTREVLLQVFTDGMSVKEIGIEFKAAVGTVEKWFHHYGISRKHNKVEECHDVNVGDATVVAIDCDDDGVYTYAVPGGGTVVGIAEAERVGAIMNEYWPRRDT